MKNPKILFILPLPPPNHGSTIMAKQIVESDLLNTNFICDNININVSIVVSEIGKFSFRKIIRIIISYFTLIFKLISNKYNLCYIANTPTGIAFIKDSVYILICKLFCKKIILHQHGKGFSSYKHKILYNFLYKICFSNVKVILLSWRLYPDISCFVNKNQVYICPNGIPYTICNPPDFKPNHNSVRLLFLSNLIRTKGVFELLDACKVLLDRGYNFECFFVGAETKEISVKVFNEEINKRNLTEKVKYLGIASFERKNSFYENCDIFIFPTFNDCFPLVLLEAMQHGLPIITTYEGAIPDIIEDNKNGLLCKSNDSQELAEKIELLIKNEQLRIILGNESQHDFNLKYKNEIFERNLLNIFSEILKS
jgi:glycosyltransferase involved in cell wall biosynthesis